jgi:CDP-diacylglycerol--serine O-phosphatidyltransferase
MKKVHLLPNVITALGLSCGLFVIFKMCMAQPADINLSLFTATAAILLLAALADLLDGAVARAMKAESEFGGIFDSLSDAITFGVGPSVIILKGATVVPGSTLFFMVTAAAMIYSVSGVLRLARFNVIANREKLDPALHDANKKNFTGLPIPAAAAAAVSMNLFLMSDEFRSIFTLSDVTRDWILVSVQIILGYLMVSRFKFPSMKSFHIRVASFRIVFLTVVTAVLLFYGILHHFPVVFFLLSWLYLVVSLILGVIRLISGKRSKTLEDFEIEPEDELEE